MATDCESLSAVVSAPLSNSPASNKIPMTSAATLASRTTVTTGARKRADSYGRAHVAATGATATGLCGIHSAPFQSHLPSGDSCPACWATTLRWYYDRAALVDLS